MDTKFSAPEEAFREEVRLFLATHLPQDITEKVRRGKRLAREDWSRWHALLNERGWLAGHWPLDRGGAGWTPVQNFLFDTECAIAHAPRIMPFGVNMLGPVLIKFGTADQQRHYLPRILDGSDWWCQGYSEPGAGSDLAAVRTTAVRDGTHYIVNGQKTWTTLGQHANRIFCLVRTDSGAKKQRGISFLLIDMDSPGVEMRPIVLLEREHEVNEVFFTNVRVPVENLVGVENEGWTCAKYLLTYERTNAAGIGLAMAAFDQLQQVARKLLRGGRPLDENPLFAARMARVEIELENMKTTNLRVLAGVAAGGAPGAESSMLKIRGTQVRQEITSLYRRAMGPHARPFPLDALESDSSPVGPEEAETAAARYFNFRKLSIFGGSNEIQRNIMAKTLLEL